MSCQDVVFLDNIHSEQCREYCNFYLLLRFCCFEKIHEHSCQSFWMVWWFFFGGKTSPNLVKNQMFPDIYQQIFHKICCFWGGGKLWLFWWKKVHKIRWKLKIFLIFIPKKITKFSDFLGLKKGIFYVKFLSLILVKIGVIH